MNRILKFRAWDEDRKEMIKVNTIYFNNSNGLYINSLLAENMQLMQYTGLKDSYSVDIYEGDILRVTDEADEVSELNSDTGIGVVEWLDKWGFWNVSNIENGLGDILNRSHVEVMGNIWQNPKLWEMLR